MAFSLPPSLSFIQKKRETGAQKKSNSINRTFLYPPHIIFFPAANIIGPIVAANIRESKKSVQFWGGKHAGKRCVHTKFRIRAHLVFRPGFSVLSFFCGIGRRGRRGGISNSNEDIFLRFYVCYVRIGCRSFLEISKKKVPLPNGDFPSHEYEYHQPSY